MHIKGIFELPLNGIEPVLIHIKRTKKNMGAIRELPLLKRQIQTKAIKLCAD